MGKISCLFTRMRLPSSADVLGWILHYDGDDRWLYRPTVKV